MSCEACEVGSSEWTYQNSIPDTKDFLLMFLMFKNIMKLRLIATIVFNNDEFPLESSFVHLLICPFVNPSIHPSIHHPFIYSLIMTIVILRIYSFYFILRIYRCHLSIISWIMRSDRSDRLFLRWKGSK